jgi:hypothetical protein
LKSWLLNDVVASHLHLFFPLTISQDLLPFLITIMITPSSQSLDAPLITQEEEKEVNNKFLASQLPGGTTSIVLP